MLFISLKLIFILLINFLFLTHPIFPMRHASGFSPTFVTVCDAITTTNWGVFFGANSRLPRITAEKSMQEWICRAFFEIES